MNRVLTLLTFLTPTLLCTLSGTAQSWNKLYQEGLTILQSNTQGQYEKAHEKFKEAYDLSNGCAIERINLLWSLHTSVSYIGSPSEELKYISELENCAIITGGKQSTAYAVALDSKALWIAKYTSNYQEAINTMKKSLAIKMADNNMTSAAITARDLGMLYYEVGQYEDALKYFLFIKKFYKHQGLDLSMSRIFDDYIANTLSKQGRLDSAIALYKELIDQFPDKYSTASRALNVSRVYLQKAMTSDKIQNLNLALDYAKKTIHSIGLTENRMLTLEEALYQIAVCNIYLGNYQLAFNQGEKAIKLLGEKIGTDNALTSEWLTRIGLAFLENEQYLKSELFLTKGIEYNADQIIKNFRYLSFEEKQKYYYLNLRPSLEAYALLTFKTQQKSLLNKLLEYNINFKSTLLNDEKRLREVFNASKNQALTDQYNKLEQYRNNYSREAIKKDANPILLNELKTEMDQLERNLSENLSIEKSKPITAQSLISHLKQEEILIDIVRVRAYKNMSWNDESIYLYNIYNKDGLVSSNSNEKGKSLEKGMIELYHNYIKYDFDVSALHEQFWEVMQVPDGYKKIYLSADGVYHQINLGTLKDKSGKYLVDKYSFIHLTSPKELLSKSTKPANKQINLFGFPSYLIEDEDSQNKTAPSDSLKRYLSFDKIATLPGTKKEVEQIEKFYPESRISKFLSKNASEYQVKHQTPSGILHIATHGFFLPSSDITKEGSFSMQNPLMRSGLLFANAQNYMDEGTLYQGEDGILTAYEIQNLDLSATHLTVLSACETGLGDLLYGEGVYGLQRAFKSAGSTYILNSLWKVDDEATSFYMIKLHEALQEGHHVESAYKIAMQSTREEFQSPQKWGAFLLVN